MPAFDLRNEQIVLATMMRHPRECRRLARTLSARDWIGERHRRFFAALQRIVVKGMEPTLDAVELHLPRGRTEAGDIGYLSQVAETYAAQGVRNIGQHVGKLRLDAVKADLLRTTWADIGEQLEDPESTAEDIAARFAHGVTRLRRRLVDGASTVGQRYDASLALRTERGVVQTGWPLLDEHYTGGFKPGWVNLVHARPKTGKTLFVVNVVSRAVPRETRIDVHAWEPGEEGFLDLLMCNLSGETTSNVIGRWAELNEGYRRELRAYLDPYLDGGLRVYGKPRWPRVRQVWDANRANLDLVESYVEASAAQVVVFDLFARCLAMRRPNDYEYAIDRVVDWAERYGKHILLLHQTKRLDKRRGDMRPQEDDVKGSGALEEYSQTVTALFRPDLYKDRFPEPVLELAATKQRYGAMFRVEFSMDPARARLGEPRLLDDGTGTHVAEQSTDARAEDADGDF